MMKKIIVKFKGGLGNQLFQYSFALSLSYKYSLPIFFDNFNLQLNHPKNTSRRFMLSELSVNYPFVSLFKKIYYFIMPFFIKNFVINDKTLNSVNDGRDTIILDGYFQNYILFDEFSNEIKDSLKLSSQNTDYTELENIILKCENSVALHIRRGDYVTNAYANKFHGVLLIDYYLQAISILRNKLKNYNIFIFSDDIKWAKENFKFDNFFFVDDTYKLSDVESLIVMSKCNHFIIANSSYSWWAAYLGSNPSKNVIYPKSWNIYNSSPISPIDWICI